MLTGKKANNGYNVTFSHIRNKKLQGANLQDRKVYWPEMQRWVTLKVSTKASVAPLQPPAANGQRIPRWPSMQHRWWFKQNWFKAVGPSVRVRRVAASF